MVGPKSNGRVIVTLWESIDIGLELYGDICIRDGDPS